MDRKCFYFCIIIFFLFVNVYSQDLHSIRIIPNKVDNPQIEDPTEPGDNPQIEDPTAPKNRSTFPMGVNVQWFNTWNECQPLANVALTGRSSGYEYVPLDAEGHPTADFGWVIYEGSTPGEIPGSGGGAQYGLHHGRFEGSAEISAREEGAISNVVYDSYTNMTTFDFTTTRASVSVIDFSNTKRLPSSPTGSGIRNIELMRPNHSFGDLMNSAFIQGMEPFSAFRIGPNWPLNSYNTVSPVWETRCKPNGLYHADDTNSESGVPWEILIAMANELGTDLWICLPPNANDDYLTKFFQTFYYGSNGDEPYTSFQIDPEWAPLDSDLKLYFEIGNEIWNTSPPYGTITEQMREKAQEEIDAGDPNNFAYSVTDSNVRLQRRLAYFIAHASQVCRTVVGDENMMMMFRPVLAGQSAWSYRGEVSLSYLKCVLGGYDYHEKWNGDNFPGEFKEDVKLTPEDGTSLNQFGNVAHPITYWIYGYAVAPYINGSSISELNSDLVDVKEHMLSAIDVANKYGVEPLAYEGGVENYHTYQETGLDTVMEDMLTYWYENGGGLFMYYAFAGNSNGIYADLTKQDPDVWPKVRAINNIVGLD